MVKCFSSRSGCPVIYHYHDINQGSAATRNTGIEVSSGEYISFLDDDDEYYPQGTEAMVSSILKRTDAEFVYAFCRAVKDDGTCTRCHRVFEGNTLFEQAFTGCICATSQWLCRKEVLVKCGCFDIVPAKDDSILLYKLPISFQFRGASKNRAESLLRSRPANPDVSDFPVIRNGWGSSRLSPENPMLEATMRRGYSVSFLHPCQVEGRGSL